MPEAIISDIEPLHERLRDRSRLFAGSYWVHETGLIFHSVDPMDRLCSVRSHPALEPGFLSGRGYAERVPFRAIYSDDTIHVLSCMRPEEKQDIHVFDELVRKSVLEVLDVDAHILQPGLGWVP